MTPNHVDNAELADWWCGNHRRYREEADEFGWREVFDAALSDFEAGMSIREVLGKHHLPVPRDFGSERRLDDVVDLRELGVDPLPARGDYGCPRVKPCGRRALADPATGREPRCAIAELPMRYRPDPDEG